MSRELFWEQVDRALDERRDPLDDAEVRRLAADAPELRDELAHLCSRLDGLSAPRRRARVRRIAAAAAVLLVAVAAAALLARAPDEPVEPETLASNPGPSRVLSFRSIVTVEDARGRTTTTLDGTRAVVESVIFASRVGDSFHSGPSFVAVASSQVFSR